jgi:hypothetical protein
MNRRWLTGAATFGAATLVFGAAALAQTPLASSGAAPLAQATGTTTGTVAVATGTSVATGTAQMTMTPGGTGTAAVTGTSVTTGTVAVPTQIPVPTNVYQPGGTGNFPYAHPAFQRVWDRTDHPVALKQIDRTWFWGPGPNSPGLMEQYNESPLGNRMRLVQYFDKSRMELNNPAADPTQAFFVTNGLLTVDLISGSVQVGENSFNRFRNACIPMTGDFGDTNAPTYRAFQNVSVSADRVDTHPATNNVGQVITQTISRDGTVGSDPAKASMAITNAVYITETRHNIPGVFWTFLNSSGLIHNTTHQTATEQLITPWNFASGLPISEAYWTRATIQGQVKDVLIQAFERRALTYVPTNPAGFQVEMANIGQHYFDWRYRNLGYCPGDPGVVPTPPAPAPTGTVVSGTPGATGTPASTGTAVSGTPAATGTAVSTTTVVVGTSVATFTPNPQQTTIVGTTTPAATTTGEATIPNPK